MWSWRLKHYHLQFNVLLSGSTTPGYSYHETTKSPGASWPETHPSAEVERTRCQVAEASSVLAGSAHSASCLRFGASSVSSFFRELNSDSSFSRSKGCEASCGHLGLWSSTCGLPSWEDTWLDLGPELLSWDSGQLGSSEEAWLPQGAEVQGMGSWKQPASLSPEEWQE